jgi:hypothetical protein
MPDEPDPRLPDPQLPDPRLPDRQSPDARCIGSFVYYPPRYRAPHSGDGSRMTP